MLNSSTIVALAGNYYMYYTLENTNKINTLSYGLSKMDR